MTSELLRDGRRGDGQPIDVRIENGCVIEVGSLERRSGESVTDLEGRLVLASFAEPHIHLDKAFSAFTATTGRVVNRAGDLDGAMAAYSSVAAATVAHDVRSRALAALRLLVASGATAVRCQVGCGPLSGVVAVEVLAELRQAVAGVVDVQVVAHAAVPPGGARAHRSLLERALDAGADHLGGNPFIEENPKTALQITLEVAADRGCGVDLHVDESPDVLTLHDVIAGSLGSGVRVVTAHCVSLARLPGPDAKAIAASAADAGVAVVTLPLTNLFLQGRSDDVPRFRGLTAISLLREAGVLVAAGADNIQDPFNPMGRCDPLETASLLVTAGHQGVEAAADMVSNEARTVMGIPPVGPVPGMPADLVAIDARSLSDALARGPGNRLVWHRGRLVARTSTSSEIAI